MRTGAEALRTSGAHAEDVRQGGCGPREWLGGLQARRALREVLQKPGRVLKGTGSQETLWRIGPMKGGPRKGPTGGNLGGESGLTQASRPTKGMGSPACPPTGDRR